MIKHHPNDCTLVKFSEGTLCPSDSLLVSAHCDMCQACAERVDTFTENLAFKAFDFEPPSHSIHSNLVELFNEITNQNQISQPCGSTAVKCDKLPSVSQAEAQKTVEQSAKQGKFLYLDGRKFELPDTLRRYNVRMGEWSKLVGKIWQSQVEIGGGYLAQFVYMEKGGSVPEHTHRGNEITLVIDGEFSDGLHRYESGDFIALNSTHRHIPSTQHEDGCLVFSIIDEPLHFTSGWAQLVNPLSNLYFRVNTR